MIKRIAVILAALLLPAAAAEAAFHLGLRGGYALFMDKSYAGAPAYGVSLGFDLARNLTVELSGTRFESSVTASADGLSAGRLALMPLEIEVEAHFPFGAGKIAVFGGLGGGYGLTTFAFDSTSGASWSAVGFAVSEKVQSTASLCAAAGLEYALSETSVLRVEVRYRLMKPTGTWSITDLLSGETVSGTLDKLNLDSLTIGLAVRIGL
jgi:outer membrane protein W